MKKRCTYTLYCVCALLQAPFNGVLAGNLAITVNDGLLVTLSGDAGDRDGTYQISTLSADTGFLRNGVDSASFGYRITGQVSADDGAGGQDDSARLSGSVNFDFSLPLALWDVKAEIVFRGAQDKEGAGTSVSAGQLRFSSSGSVSGLGGYVLDSGSLAFFDKQGGSLLYDQPASGFGSVGLQLDMRASSNDVLLYTGGEAFAGIGQFSSLDSFSLDDNLDALDPIMDDGIYLKLTFTPSLDLYGQSLWGDLALENGEVLSGYGEVTGQVTGAAGSAITAGPSGLTLGRLDFDGTLNIGDGSLSIDNEGVLRGNVTLAGGTLTAGTGILLAGAASLSGHGEVAADVSGDGGAVITAEPSGLVLGQTSFSFEGTLNVGTATVVLQDADGAELGISTTLAGGVLRSPNGLVIDGSDSISGYGIIIGDVRGGNAGGGLLIAVPTGSVNRDGTLDVGSDTARVYSRLPARLGNSTLLAGGTLIAQNGIVLDGADTLSGYGIIRGSIIGTNVENGLFATGGYTPSGTLDIGSDQVTILTNAVVRLQDTNLSGGQLRTTVGSFTIGEDAVVSGHGSIVGEVDGLARSAIVAAEGNLILGDTASFNGFRTRGEIQVGVHEVTLNSATFATLGTVTTLNGGVLSAANGIFLGGGTVITGSGAVDARIAAEAGSLITATGNLDLGDASAFDGYYSRGNLEVNSNTVTLHDANEAKLGALTTLGDINGGGGVLAADNGVVLNGGHSIVGYGLISADLENQGSVIGQGPQPGDALELSGFVKGIGDFSGNIIFSGTFSPGNSPAEVTLENVDLAGVLEIEIGGLIAGEEYDWLNMSGNVDLGGTLVVSFLDLGSGLFSPSEGDSFDLFIAEDISGSFASLLFPELDPGLTWQFRVLTDAMGSRDIARLSVSSVPVPPAVWLFGSGLLGLAGVARRRQRAALRRHGRRGAGAGEGSSGCRKTL